MTSADIARDVGQSEVNMLGIYLNDHLAGATGRVLKLFQFTHLDTFFPFFPTVEDACQGLG